MSSRRQELWLETCGIVAITLAPSLASTISGREADASSMIAADFYAWALEQVGWVLLIVYFLRRDAAFDWRLPASIRDWAKEIAASLFLLAATWYFSSQMGTVSEMLGAEGQTSFWDEVARNPNLALAAWITMPVSVLAEEMVFRVYLQTRLSELLGGKPFLVMLLSAGFFAAVHDYSGRDVWEVFTFGAILGASYLMNRRIPRLFLAHLATNVLIRLG